MISVVHQIVRKDVGTHVGVLPITTTKTENVILGTNIVNDRQIVEVIVHIRSMFVIKVRVLHPPNAQKCVGVSIPVQQCKG
jgi:hypothetical protein